MLTAAGNASGAAEDPARRALVQQLIEGDERAWSEFVHSYSNLIFSLLWRYARNDRDLCTDLYTFVLQALRRPDSAGRPYGRFRRYLKSLERVGSGARLTTWLGRVTHNLVSDYFRFRDGRRTEPREIERLDPVARELFRLLYWEGLSEQEAYNTLAGRHQKLSQARFDTLLLEINRRLSRCNRWSLYSEVLRRCPALPLHPQEHEGESRPAPQVAADSPEADPETSASRQEQKQQARQAMLALLQLLQQLPAERRLLILGRFRQGLTAVQLGRLLGLTQRQVYSALEQTTKQLREQLAEHGFAWEDLAAGLEEIDGMLELLAAGSGEYRSGRAVGTG